MHCWSGTAIVAMPVSLLLDNEQIHCNQRIAKDAQSTYLTEEYVT